MRLKVDKQVEAFYDSRPFRREERDTVTRMNPGAVVALNDCVFLQYKKAAATSIKERLISSSERMPGKDYKQKYCMAVLSQANIGSLYLSIAAQYALYYITSDEVEKCDIKTFIEDSGKSALIGTLDIKVLENIVADIISGYEECNPDGDKLLEVADMM